MKQANIYNKLVRYYNRSRRKLHILAVEGKNLRKQSILQKRIARLFKSLTGMQRALKLGMATAALSAGMLMFQPNAAQSQPEITFGAVQNNPVGLVNISIKSTPAFSDLDGDGDMDMMSGDNLGNFFYFQNTGTAAAPAFAAPQTNPFGLTDIGIYSAPAFADLDGDGDMDLLAGNRNGNFVYFQNTGTVASPGFAAAQTNPFGLTDIGYFYLVAPAFADLDGDGDMDLLAGEYFDNFFYCKNTGTSSAPAFAAAQTNPFGLTVIGYSFAPTFSDLDGDGDMDLIAGEYYGKFSYFQNTGTPATPAFADAQGNPFGLTDIGYGSTPALVDLDGDGDMDLMSGENSGDFFYFENNTSCPGLTVFADADGDSYGDSGNSLFVADCIPPGGYVFDSTDCNDNNGSIHPGACDAANGNGVDDNCDAAIDNGSGATNFYADADGDDYGTGSGTSLCSDPGVGYSTNNKDCNDLNASINPGATEVANGIDDNCNGIIDDVACPVPVNLPVKNITSSSAKVRWFIVANALRYKLRYKVTGSSTWTTITNISSASKKISGLAPNTSYTCQVKSVCSANPIVSSDWSSKQTFTTGSLRLNDESLQQVSFSIYPNPAEDHATIQFTLPKSSHVYIKVYDVSGKEIKTLLDSELQQGEHSLQLNTNQFSKGVYMVQMISDAGIENQKLIVQ